MDRKSQPITQTTSIHYARSNAHTSLCHRPRQHRYHFLVYPTSAANPPQLENEIHRRSTCYDDVLMDPVWDTFWGICNSAELQFADPGAAAMLLFIVSSDLVSMFVVRKVRMALGFLAR